VLASAIDPSSLGAVFRARLTEGRKLDFGNPTPANLGADFRRLGMDFWPEVDALHAWNPRRRRHLEDVNAWRNAIAHQDFDPAQLGGSTTLHLARVDSWRSICGTFEVPVDELLQAPPV
jgi:hypothetical protein